MSDAKLINGDCIKEMQKLIDDGVKVDMVLTDPPYGTTACKWDSIIPFEPMWKCLEGLCYNTTPILLFGTEPFSSNLRMSNIKKYRYDWIWQKSRFTNFLFVKKQPAKITENISVFYKNQPNYIPQMEKEKPYTRKATGKPKTYDLMNNPAKDKGKINKSGLRYPKNILKFKFHNVGNYHPTQKPVPLLEYLIKTYTNEGDIVLDFTMGSGSTGVACLQTNRNFIGIELDKEYYEIAKKRINEAKAQRRLI